MEAFLAALEHPRKAEVLALRQVILGSDPRIGEVIKWNAPTFQTTRDFVTFHLRAKDAVQVILHLGARTPQGANPRGAISDPEGLLRWLGEDRASVAFHDLAEVQAKAAAFSRLIRQWIDLLPA